MTDDKKGSTSEPTKTGGTGPRIDPNVREVPRPDGGFVRKDSDDRPPVRIPERRDGNTQKD